MKPKKDNKTKTGLTKLSQRLGSKLKLQGDSSPTNDTDSFSADIKVFSSPFCDSCQQVKAYLKSKQVAFVEVDVSRESTAVQEMYDLTGQNAIPVTLFTKTGQFVVGFNQKLLDDYLGSS